MPRATVILLLALLAGCSLGDYEARMDAQRARVRSLDEENRYLDELVELPFVVDEKDKDKNEKMAWPFDIFVRLPRGISGKRADLTTYQGLYHPRPVTLYRYPGKEANFFVAAGRVVDAAKKNPAADEWTATDFRQRVEDALGNYYHKQTGQALKFPEKSDAAPVPGFTHLSFDDAGNKALKDHSHFDLYFYDKGGLQVALVYQFSEKQAKDTQIVQARDLSLKSFDVSDAPQKRARFTAQQLRRKKA